MKTKLDTLYGIFLSVLLLSFTAFSSVDVTGDHNENQELPLQTNSEYLAVGVDGDDDDDDSGACNYKESDDDDDGDDDDDDDDDGDCEILPPGCLPSYASYVVDFNQGTRQNGHAVKPSASDPHEALGEPSYSPNSRYVALGFGGDLTLGFLTPIINIDGDDFLLVETTPPGQDDCATTPEMANVEASQDGNTWVDLGDVCLTESLDLGSLPWASYIRITDISDINFAGFQPSDDGFDVDGITAVGCPAQPVYPLLDCVTTDADGDGNIDMNGGNIEYTAKFSYQNENSTTVNIPVGNLNGFSPNPIDRGQPDDFLTGLNEDAFTVAFDGDPITWTLTYPVSNATNTVTASKDSDLCEGAPTPTPGPTATPTPVPTPPSVDPILECVRNNSDGSFTARFGYDNNNDRTVLIPVGSSVQGTNTFTPGTDKGQPEAFKPGRHFGVFEVRTKAKELKWALKYKTSGTRTVTATKASEKCNGLRPTRQCVFQHPDGNFRAIYGYKNPEPFPIEIEVGRKNRFVPKPKFRGQPTHFQTGSHPVRFIAKFEDGEERIKWKLEGRRKNASILKPGQRCGVPPVPVCTINDPIVTTCDGFTTTVTLEATMEYDPDPIYPTPSIDYTWKFNCDDPNATFDDIHTLTPSITLVSPADGDQAFCRATITGTKNDPLVDDAVCRTTVTVEPCIEDCDGIPGGPGVPDQCGVCNGDDSTCSGCDGVPNSGCEFDECGVCCGDGTTCIPVDPEDCDGVPGGSNPPDRCGVCNGDGTSCLDCESVDILGAQLGMDGASSKQRDLNYQAAELLRQYDSSNSARVLARTSENASDELELANWALTWSLDNPSTICGNDVLCTHDDTNSEIVHDFNGNSFDLARIGINLLNENDDAPSDAKKRLRRRMRAAFRAAVTASSQVPPYTSECPEV